MFGFSREAGGSECRGGVCKTDNRENWETLSLAVVALLLLLGIIGPPRGLGSSPEPGPFPQGLRAFNLDGQAVDPFVASRAKAVVFIFVALECPISNSYMPEYQRLERAFKGIEFNLVYPNADESAEQIRKHLKDFTCTVQALRDPRHELVKVSQARVTPEAAVFLAGRGLIYHGRIDDRYADLGKARPAATTCDLRDVLQAISDGKVPSPRTTKAVGCYISGTR